MLLDFCRIGKYEWTDEEPPWTGQVDGMLLSVGFTHAPADSLQWYFRGAVPVVSVAADVLDPRLPVVFTDPVSIAGLAVDHLRKCGCRRLIHVGFQHSIGSHRRAAALRAAAADAGLPVAEYDLLTRLTDDTQQTAVPAEQRVLSRLLKEPPQPVGVLALNDTTARYVWELCLTLGMEVPRDVAILGVDDSPVAFGRQPTLSSIRYPGEAVGYQAMELLTKLIAGGRRPRKPVLVPATHLSVRQSTGGDEAAIDEVATVLELIHRQSSRKLKIGDLVEAVAMSRRSLELAFQKRLGRSPAVEIQRLRLAQAKELLSRTAFPIQRVAELLDFAEPASFNKFFRIHTGMTPTSYRRKSQRHAGLK